MSKLSRAVRFVLGIWVVAMCLAVPQVFIHQFIISLIPNSKMYVENVLTSDHHHRLHMNASFVVT